MNEQVEEDLAEEKLAEEGLSEDDWEYESTGGFLCDQGLVYHNRFCQVIYSRFLLCLLLISPVIYSRL